MLRKVCFWTINTLKFKERTTIKTMQVWAVRCPMPLIITAFICSKKWALMPIVQATMRQRLRFWTLATVSGCWFWTNTVCSIAVPNIWINWNVWFCATATTPQYFSGQLRMKKVGFRHKPMANASPKLWLRSKNNSTPRAPVRMRRMLRMCSQVSTKWFRFAGSIIEKTALRIITATIRISRLWEQKWAVPWQRAAFMKKTPFAATCQTKTLRFRGGRVRRKNGGVWRLRITIGWAVLSGRVLIIAANQRPIRGPISIPILGLWICVVFQKIFIITINLGGQTKMCCTFRRIGIGKAKKDNRLMFGWTLMRTTWNCS